MSKVVVDAGGCWLWAACLDAHGYGRIAMPGRGGERAYRVSYEVHIGPIPEGMQLDHLCRVRACVNPAHVEPVTLEENVRRGNRARAIARRTHFAKEAVA